MATAVRKTNWFAIWISVAVVVVLVALAGIVIAMNNAATGPGTTPVSSNIDTETGAIAIGTGEPTVDTYIDFMCPICNSFEQTYGETLDQQATSNAITLNIHPISILDRLSQGTEYSTRAASAMYCVAEEAPESALPFLKAMYAAQPAENSAGLTDAEIIGIATQAGASDPAVGDCITEGRYTQFVTSMTPKTPIQEGQSGIATPTLVINGQTVPNTTLTGDPQADILDKLGL